MICAHCNSQIDEDSIYCDQCGVEILVCIKCGKPGKSKFCDIDGGKITSKRQIDNTNKSTINNLSSVNPNNNSSHINNSASLSNTSIKNSKSSLRLVNNTLNINIIVNHLDIIGRTTGAFASQFGRYDQISSKHLQFHYLSNGNWQIIDLGSTNGTAINKTPKWENISKIQPNTPATINCDCFLLLGDIELKVSLHNVSITGTRRV